MKLAIGRAQEQQTGLTQVKTNLWSQNEMTLLRKATVSQGSEDKTNIDPIILTKMFS